MAKPEIESPDEVKRQAREAFNDRAEHYALERERLPYFQAQLKIVLAMLTGEGGRILDIGCAAGGEIPMLQRQGFSVVGIDLSPEMLRFAHRRFAATRTWCSAEPISSTTIRVRIDGRSSLLGRLGVSARL